MAGHGFAVASREPHQRTAPMNALTNDTAHEAFLAIVERDANGAKDATAGLLTDPQAWRDALVELLGDLRIDAAAVNAEIAELRRTRPKGGRERLFALQNERTAIVERQVGLEGRLTVAKKACHARIEAEAARRLEVRRTMRASEAAQDADLERDDAIETARQLLYRALDILRDVQRADGTAS